MFEYTNTYNEQRFQPDKKGMIDMFGKLTKTDVFYLVTFGLTLGFLYFSMITSA